MTHHNHFSLNGKRALITGASGGIGAAMARMFVQCGATVTLSGTRLSVLDSLKQDLCSENPSAIVHILTCNLTGAASDDTDALPGADALVKESLRLMGGLDVLINNAGITRDGLLMRMKDADWASVIQVNLTACFEACRAAIKPMMTQRSGRIINISSVVGVGGNAGQTNYCASKAGMIGFSKALAQESATRGITVNCIAPGFIESAMTDGLPDAVKEKISSTIPMQRMGQADDIAAGAVFLASDAGRYITGQTLHINGGMLMA